MTNTIDTLRDELFATLRALRDPANPMDIERARAVSDVAQTIINSAKVEVDHARITGQKSGSGFLPADRPAPATPAPALQHPEPATDEKPAPRYIGKPRPSLIGRM